MGDFCAEVLRRAQDAIFETYTVQSASTDNVINLRVPLSHLHRALRSALSATSASIRLTKKDNIPLLSLTITTSNFATARALNNITTTTIDPPSQSLDPTNDNQNNANPAPNPRPDAPTDDDSLQTNAPTSFDRETTITQEIPIMVLPAAEVSHLHEPVCPQPDIHILLPPLAQIKSVSERFTKLALSSHQLTTHSASSSRRGGATQGPSTADAPSSASRLTLSANANGEFKIAVETPSLKIESKWQNLTNPELDPAQIEGGEDGVAGHASTVMKERAARGEDSWASVRVEGRDWGRVLSIGRMGGGSRVVACFCDGHALVLYVYLEDQEAFGGGGVGEAEGGSVLTVSKRWVREMGLLLTMKQYYIASYSA
ncbi:uncharacterized protein KY384_003619 [Bacidia gigantensis]|uniref:uncharacterized protein n=1 Tax=Bacidia gigantensis TaxID=2732470 RepID=UPI001D05AF94|nr:uncharacterized protein KY384_003619 [Bacidia gigantensis]KAG8531983.1 hypothetical protein KY384_003619 [Bacidia gigantensis]